MALAVASVANATPNTGTTITCNKPTGTASGDLLILQLTEVETSGNPLLTFTPPSGWTLIRTDGTSLLTRSCQSAIYYLVAGSSEPSSYTATISGGTGAFGASIARITGTTVGSSIPSAQNGQAVASYFASPSYSISITPPDASSLLLFFVAFTQNSTVSSYNITTSNPTWTQQWNVTASPGANIGYAMASAVRVQTTATGNAGLTGVSPTDSSGETVGQMISIFHAPAAPGGINSNFLMFM